jgi:hypothetical protein
MTRKDWWWRFTVLVVAAGVGTAWAEEKKTVPACCAEKACPGWLAGCLLPFCPEPEATAVPPAPMPAALARPTTTFTVRMIHGEMTADGEGRIHSQPRVSMPAGVPISVEYAKEPADCPAATAGCLHRINLGVCERPGDAVQVNLFVCWMKDGGECCHATNERVPLDTWKKVVFEEDGQGQPRQWLDYRVQVVRPQAAANSGGYSVPYAAPVPRPAPVAVLPPAVGRAVYLVEPPSPPRMFHPNPVPCPSGSGLTVSINDGETGGLKVATGNGSGLTCERFEMRTPKDTVLRCSADSQVCLQVGSTIQARADSVCLHSAGPIQLKGNVRLHYSKAGEQPSDVRADEVVLTAVSEEHVEIRIHAALAPEGY